MREQLKLSLDRKNNNKGYERGNLRWATQKEQALNTRRTRLVTINNETKTIKEWCSYLNISESLVYNRIKMGASSYDALSTPGKKYNILTLNGKSQTVTKWAKELGISVRTLFGRKRNGWSDEKALTTPVRNNQLFYYSTLLKQYKN